MTITLKVTRFIQRKATDLYVAALRAHVTNALRTGWGLETAANDAQEAANALLRRRNDAQIHAEIVEEAARAEAERIGGGL